MKNQYTTISNYGPGDSRWLARNADLSTFSVYTMSQIKLLI